jgi:hypothetical protein
MSVRGVFGRLALVPCALAIALYLSGCEDNGGGGGNGGDDGLYDAEVGQEVTAELSEDDEFGGKWVWDTYVLPLEIGQVYEVTISSPDNQHIVFEGEEEGDIVSTDTIVSEKFVATSSAHQYYVYSVADRLLNTDDGTIDYSFTVRAVE